MKKILSNCKGEGEDSDEEVCENLEALDFNANSEVLYGQSCDPSRYINQCQKLTKKLGPVKKSKKGLSTETNLCNICRKTDKVAFVTNCNHYYCLDCFTNYQENHDNTKCIHCEKTCIFEKTSQTNEAYLSPMSKSKHQGSDARHIQRRKRSEDVDEIRYWIKQCPSFTSAKVLAVMCQLKNWWKQDPSAKIVVYTQFIEM